MCVALGRGQHSPKAADWGFTVPCPVFRLAHLESSRAACSLKFLMLHTLTHDDGSRVRPARRTIHERRMIWPAPVPPDRAPELPVPVRGRPRRARARWVRARPCRVRRRRRADRGLSKPHELKSRATANSDRGRRRRGEATGAAWRARSAPIVMTGDRAAGRRELGIDPDPRGPGISYRDEDPALRPGSTPVEPALPGT